MSQGVDNGDRHVIEWLGTACAEVENARLFRVIEKPEINVNHVIDENEVAHLTTGTIAAVVAKQFDLAFGLKLVELADGVSFDELQAATGVKVQQTPV